jgi:hypothetical protein
VIITNKVVKSTAEMENLNSGNFRTTIWSNEEIRSLWKENIWFERQLTLSKSDKINMGIDLTNKTIEVQLKGTVLLQAQIMKQYPSDFMKDINQNAYINLFGHIAAIDSEWCNYPKKPIVKVLAPKDSSEVQTKIDTLKEARFEWRMNIENKFNVVINGVVFNEDSVKEIKRFEDIYRFRKDEILNKLNKDFYKPTLFLWLDDKDVKAIYRAIPEKGQVIFRN